MTCPLHQRRFDLATGAPLGHDCPAIAVHPVQIREDEVYVCVTALAGARERVVAWAAASTLAGAVNPAAASATS